MYRDTPFPRFILALAIASLPALWLERQDERWAWRYVVVVLLGMGILNAPGIQAFANFLVRELGGKNA